MTSAVATGKQKATEANTSTGSAANTAPEVIQDWADGDGGFTFERGRMEAAVRNLCFEQPISALPPNSTAAAANAKKSAFKPKRDDVEFIVKELMLTKPIVEQALIENDGDMTKTLTQLMRPADTKTTTTMTTASK